VKGLLKLTEDKSVALGGVWRMVIGLDPIYDDEDSLSTFWNIPRCGRRYGLDSSHIEGADSVKLVDNRLCASRRN
jgi:hypothetical protein